MISFLVKILSLCSLAVLTMGPSFAVAREPGNPSGGEPVEQISSTRTRQVLNGLWDFQPASSAERPNTSVAWAKIHVPGAWYLQSDWNQMKLLPGFDAPLPKWDAVTTLNFDNPDRIFAQGIGRAWYRKVVKAPDFGKGDDLVLTFKRVSTDAVVFVDGVKAGETHWPDGEVVLSEKVKPGQTFTLDVLVLATPSEKDLLFAMREDYSEKGQGGLRAAGITGDVYFQTRPQGPRLDGMAVETSIRKKLLVLRPDFAGKVPAGSVKFDVTVKNWPSGEVVHTWSKKASIGADGVLSEALSFPWADAKLWEIGEPTLYTVELSAKGKGWQDSQIERFGFREFRIEGRNFLLNEKPVRFRPNGAGADQLGLSPVGSRAELKRQLDLGFTVLEIWPNDVFRRSYPDGRPSYAVQADEVGMPLMFPLIRPDDVFDWKKPFSETTAERARWLKANRDLVKQVRNNPSVFIYLFYGNEFMTADDQNPLRLGRRAALDASQGARDVSNAKALLEQLRELDPTRPHASHSGASVGDIHTVNHYIGVTPLQEREEMLSAWAKDGDMPYMAVEFASPFGGDLNRARRAWNTGSEPLVTEFFAGMQGPNAYDDETPEYRERIPKTFVSKLDFNRWPQHTGYAPFDKQQADDSEALWRAWRTWGVSGGMIQWEKPFEPTPNSPMVAMGGWKPGKLGVWFDQLPGSFLTTAAQVKADLSPAGKQFFAMNSPALAYIAGKPGDWPEKGHIFLAGETLLKQVALLNDTRHEAKFDLTWKATLPNGVVIAEGPVKTTIDVGAIEFRPIDFILPQVTEQTQVILTLSGRAGENAQNDTFIITVLPAPAAAEAEKLPRSIVFDPEGTSAAWLQSLGYKTVSLADRMKDGPAGPEVLIIGRHALERGGWPQGFDLSAFITQGGRAVLLGQSPDFLRNKTGLRVHQWVNRTFFPVGSQQNHPIIKGLNADLFRDWRGQGSLVPEIRDSELLPLRRAYPRYGYGWGTRGSVSSAAWEKPHYSGWTPLLEGEFDLAYSPLMELRHGHGLLVYSGLDLENRQANEPMAVELGRRIINYAATTPLPAIRPVFLLGDKATFGMWQLLGQPVTTVPASAGLLIVAADANPPSDALRRFMRGGGNVFFLPRAAGDLPLGMKAETRKFNRGEVPLWPELRGISVAELRVRSEVAFPLITRAPEGVEISAGGAFARVREGAGTAIFCQLDAKVLDAEKLTYFRYSEWRLTRASSQVMANLGASFAGDATFFTLKPNPYRPIDLVREWKLKEEVKMPSSPSPDQPSIDPGNRGFEQKWHMPATDDSDWTPVSMPTMLTGQGGINWERSNGAAWFRLKFTVLADWKDAGAVTLHLGTLDDGDVVYINGASVGRTQPSGSSWNQPRAYKVPAWVLKPGQENTIAVRIFNQYGGGGFGAQSLNYVLRLELQKPPSASDYYVPGFRQDQGMGDDPARYTRW